MITEQINLVECCKCRECGTSIAINLDVYDTELELYEFTCPRCQAATGAVDRRFWRLPRSLQETGHFTMAEYEKLDLKKMAVGR